MQKVTNHSWRTQYGRMAVMWDLQEIFPANRKGALSEEIGYKLNNTVLRRRNDTHRSLLDVQDGIVDHP